MNSLIPHRDDLRQETSARNPSLCSQFIVTRVVNGFFQHLSTATIAQQINLKTSKGASTLIIQSLLG